MAVDVVMLIHVCEGHTVITDADGLTWDMRQFAPMRLHRVKPGTMTMIDVDVPCEADAGDTILASGRPGTHLLINGIDYGHGKRKECRWQVTIYHGQAKKERRARS